MAKVNRRKAPNGVPKMPKTPATPNPSTKPVPQPAPVPKQKLAKGGMVKGKKKAC